MTSPEARRKHVVRHLRRVVQDRSWARDRSEYRLTFLSFQADEGVHVSPEEMAEATREYEAAAEALRVAEQTLRAELTPRERRAFDKAAPTPSFRSLARLSSRRREDRARRGRAAARSGLDSDDGGPANPATPT
jgi:hypothetical protein